MKRSRWIAGLLVGLALAGPAAAATFEIKSGDGANLVKFTSKAPGETFDGKTRAVSGRVDLDPAALGDSLSILVTVDMAKLDTGIALRNRHMCENHLHTAKFPQATFEGAKIQDGGGTALVAGEKRVVALAGRLTLHGVTKEVVLPVVLTWDGADALRVASEFSVALADYEIPRPQFLAMKLGEVQKVSVSFVAKRGAPSS